MTPCRVVLGLSWLLIALVGSAEGRDEPRGVRVSEVMLHGDMDCFKVETPTATYLYGKRGAGFASILDKDGHDWISYRPGGKARGEYRGLPKCGQPTKFFHCGYGYGQYPTDNPFVSRVTVQDAAHARIESETRDGKSACAWDFYPDHATLTLLRIGQPTFWFLYEGTPGGRLDAADDFVIRPDGRKTTLDQAWSQVVPWVCFGAIESPVGFVCVNHQGPARGETDSYVSWPFRKEDDGSFQDMTVFGFGRKGYKELVEHVPDLTRLPARYSIGFVDRADFATARATCERLLTAGPSPEEYERFIRSTRGDAKRGRALFADAGRLACGKCHRVRGEGGDVGPELSDVGGKFDRPQLVESVLYPSRQIVEGYRSTVVATRGGRVVAGVVREESAESLTLLDAEGRREVVRKSEIEERKPGEASIMPQDVATRLTREEFADLIAYLESLRSAGQSTPGSGVVGPVALPPGFARECVAKGITGATAMETAPDGRVFICEQTGALRVVKDNVLLPEPFVTIEVDSTWERGLIGVALDPRFARNGYVYVCSVFPTPHPHHRISRFTAVGDVAATGSETILFEGDDQTRLGGSVPAGHQGGAIHFGADGKLYVALGDQTAGAPAQRLDTLQGKLLRLNPDGSVPEDNPFYETARGKYRAIWALGLRNPFSFAVQPGTGRIFLNDVGETRWEEIDEGIAGANYGWPLAEGPTSDPRFRGPIHHYPVASIAGSAFCPTGRRAGFPPHYQGRYFFADFVKGWIKTLDPDHPDGLETFATGLARPVDLKFAPDGSLYVLLRDAWVKDPNFRARTGSLHRIRAGESP
jgi:putative heme-binding domain-containing protein